MNKLSLGGLQAWRSRATLATLALSAVLAACGGGGGSSPAPSFSSLQSASGTVTGFGSVFVDGVELEDANALVQAENADGSFSNVPLRLGQRVRVAHDGMGTASHVTVDAAVIGAVASVDAANSLLVVAGQRVLVNNDAAVGPLTTFGDGYTALADVVAGDLVQVHGSPVYNSTLNAYDIQATRIDKQSAISAIRVMGTVSNLDTTAKAFNINGLLVNYTSATLAPSTDALANGQTVAVWGPTGSVSSANSVTTLNASRVRVMNPALADTVTSGLSQLGGLVSNYDATAQTLTIEGVKVNVASAIITPSGAVLGNAAYVQVKGTFGSDGVLQASNIAVRQANTASAMATVRLNGVISSLTDATSFVVRGVPVDASSATLSATCTSTPLASGVFVNVVATAQANTDVVLASKVTCVPPVALPPLAMRDVTGSVASVDATTSTLTLNCTACTTPLTVQWSAQTAFTGVTAATLQGATVKVDGYLNAGGVLVAREIHVPNLATDAYDPPVPTQAGMPPPVNAAWIRYRNRR